MKIVIEGEMRRVEEEASGKRKYKRKQEEEKGHKYVVGVKKEHV